MAIEQHANLGEQLRQTRSEANQLRGELGSIASEVQELLQLEMQLARAEIVEAERHAMKGAAFGGVTALFGLIGSIFLFLALMFALDTFLPTWAAAFVTALVAIGLAALAMSMARGEFKQFSPAPKRFMRTFKEDIQWARSQMNLSAR